MRTVGNPDRSRPQDAATALDVANAHLRQRPPRTCLWPPCAQPVRAADKADDRPGGRPTSYCSELHQRRNSAEVRGLQARRDELSASRPLAPVLQQREIDGVLAEIDRRLATHGAAPGTAAAPGAADRAPRHTCGPSVQGAAPPGLRLREGHHPEDLAVDWEALRDASDGVRPLLPRVAAAKTDTEQGALVAAAAQHFLRLAQAVDMVIVSVIRSR